MKFQSNLTKSDWQKVFVYIGLIAVSYAISITLFLDYVLMPFTSGMNALTEMIKYEDESMFRNVFTNEDGYLNTDKVSGLLTVLFSSALGVPMGLWLILTGLRRLIRFGLKKAKYFPADNLKITRVRD